MWLKLCRWFLIFSHHRTRGKIRQKNIRTSLLAATLPQALVQPRRARKNFGNSEFQARCASWHGVSGKGNGGLVPLLHVVRRN